MSRIIHPKTPCQIQNIILHSNDLTNAAWIQQGGLTSVTKDQVDPFGVPNNACRIVGGGGGTLVFRQNISGIPIGVGDHFCISAWVKRVSGDRLIDFDVGDGSTPKTRRVSFPTDNDWYFTWLVCEAGANSWIDINLPTGSGDGTFDVSRIIMNEGNIPFLYKETTTSRQDRVVELRDVAPSDMWRVGNEVAA